MDDVPAKKAEYQKLQRELKRMDEENRRLDTEIKALKSDPKAIEKEAREQLRYAKPGEVIYLFRSSRDNSSRLLGAGGVGTKIAAMRGKTVRMGHWKFQWLFL